MAQNFLMQFFLENFTKSYAGAPSPGRLAHPPTGILDPQLLPKVSQNKLSVSGGGIMFLCNSPTEIFTEKRESLTLDDTTVSDKIR